MIVAKLKVFGQEFEVVNAGVMYHRMVNPKTGRAGAEPLGGLIHLDIYSSYDDSLLLRWITHAEEGELCKLNEGELSYHEGALDNPAIFEYKFNDAALVEYKEVFNSQGEQPMTISLVISPAIQKYKWQTLIKHWQESWVPPSEQQPYQSAENEEETRDDFKFIATLRRKENYKGEFGFDWMRGNYKDICENYEELKKEYEQITIHNKEYFVPWLSIVPRSGKCISKITYRPHRGQRA